MDCIYEQFADFMIQMSLLKFPSIGAISPLETAPWTVALPLTHDMNTVLATAGFPPNQCPTGPFARASDFLANVARSMMTILKTQRNIINSCEIGRRSYIARACFAAAIGRYWVTEEDNGPFPLVCDDMGPHNAIADERGRIKAVIDFEFTNAMPVQFACDVPAWLLPPEWPYEQLNDEFLALVQPKVYRFICAVEKREATLNCATQPSLSEKMRKSWQSGQFWFNWAARRTMDIDEIFWSFINPRTHDGDKMLRWKDPPEMELMIENGLARWQEYYRDAAQRLVDR